MCSGASGVITGYNCGVEVEGWRDYATAFVSALPTPAEGGAEGSGETLHAGD